MVLLGNLALEILGFFFEIFGALIWGLFEGILSKSDVVVGFFLFGLLIAVILFCTLSLFWATIWSIIEIVVMIILGFAVDASK